MAIDFNVTVPIYDREYGSIRVVICGQADVTGPDEERAKSVIDIALMQAAGEIAKDNDSYIALADNKSRMEEKAAAALQDREIQYSGVRVTEIAPSEDSLEYIEMIKRKKEAAAMSPEEIAKKMEAATLAAQEMLSKMTPEQKRQAEENAKKMMQDIEKKQSDIMADVQNILEKSRPKFCPDCGTPNNGGKFCTNCGSQF